MKKTYSELSKLETFEERLEYLYIGNMVAHETFGQARIINQKFYASPEWRRVRREIIIRDMGCDLGIDGCGLNTKNILIHHITPITIDDILERRSCILDPENLISVSHTTHNYIHYGAKQMELPLERSPNDTCPWKTERR